MPDTAASPAFPVPPAPSITMSTTGPAHVTTSTSAPVASLAPPRETLGQRVGDFFHRGEQDMAAVIARAPGIEAAIRDHAGQVFDVAGEVLSLLSLIDPQAAPAVAAGDLVLAKVLSMVTSAAAIAAKVTPVATAKPAA